MTDDVPLDVVQEAVDDVPSEIRVPYNIHDPAHVIALRQALARRRLSAFVRYTYGGNYLMGWVHEEICQELDRFLQAVMEKKSPRLMITMPPRHGKSEIASRRFPAYCFGRNPDISIIAASYSADLASRMNRDTQRIVDCEEFKTLFPETKLWGKNVRTVADGSYQRNSDIFEIVGHQGVYRSAGVGGGITGMGGDILIVDDPFKDRAEANSATIREKVWDWYSSTLYTRLAPGGGILLINTRWHMDDLSGRLLEADRADDGDHWKLVNYPAIAEFTEKHRVAGEALHPERYNVEQLTIIKNALGRRDWESLYQQHPVPDGGVIFMKEWIKSYVTADLPKRFDKVLISWDMTFKEGDESDFVVGQVWGKAGASCYLLDQVRGRWGFTKTMEQFKQLAEKWPQAMEKLVEDKANGPAVIDSLKYRIHGIIPVEPDGSKTARAHAVSPLFEAGNVFLPDRNLNRWVDDFKMELLQFPSGAHDDQVDAMTQALRHMYAKPAIVINPEILRRNTMRLAA